MLNNSGSFPILYMLHINFHSLGDKNRPTQKPSLVLNIISKWQLSEIDFKFSSFCQCAIKYFLEQLCPWSYLYSEQYENTTNNTNGEMKALSKDFGKQQPIVCQIYIG